MGHHQNIIFFSLAALILLTFFVLKHYSWQNGNLESKQGPMKVRQKDNVVVSTSIQTIFETSLKQPEHIVKHLDETATLLMVPSFFQCDPTKFSRYV
jgi:hypothetical protein